MVTPRPRGGPRGCTAFLSSRHAPLDSLEYYPTPPWATRALVAHVLPAGALSGSTVWEPACGEGHMAIPLAESADRVIASDVWSYGFGEVRDFLDGMPPPAPVDWVITNPPFLRLLDFALRGLSVARQGVAQFVRLSALEGRERYERLYRPHPPSIVAPFAERVPLVAGRVDPEASSAAAYCWIVWQLPGPDRLEPPRWIPPCRAQLERPGDYEIGSGARVVPVRQGSLPLEGAP